MVEIVEMDKMLEMVGIVGIVDRLRDSEGRRDKRTQVKARRSARDQRK